MHEHKRTFLLIFAIAESESGLDFVFLLNMYLRNLGYLQSAQMLERQPGSLA
jgi:hypothetical protein